MFSWALTNLVCVLQVLKLLLVIVFTTLEMIKKDSLLPIFSKVFTSVARMTRLLHQLTNIIPVFMMLSVAWAEDKRMFTQGKLQQDNVDLVSKFKMKTKHPSVKRLQNTKFFWLVECSSVAEGARSLFSVLLAETFIPSIGTCEASRIFHL